MKIGVNALQVRAAKSGVGQYIHALLEAMVEQAPEDRFTIYCTRENVANYTLPAANLESVVWGLPQGARTARLIYEYAFLPGEIRRRGINVFHGTSNFLPPRKVCPYVVTIHDLSYFVHPERCPPVRRRYWYAMTARTVAIADAIITDSENSRSDIERFFPGTGPRITVIPLAAHPRFRLADYSRQHSTVGAGELALDGHPYLLYVGTLEPGKNVQRIIEAFDAVAGQFPDHLLALVGDRGWLFEGIFQAAECSPFRDRIRFLGHRPDDEVVDLFRFCDAFVYPSLYEGFGLPPLEAMACGAPVITSNSSSVPEVVGDAAVMVDPTSVKEIASAMRRVLSDSALRKDLSIRGLERATLFSWQKAARETLAVYRSLGEFRITNYEL